MSLEAPEDLTEAWTALGRQLAERRKAAGHTQASLAPLTFYTRSTVANVESGRQRIGRDFWNRCDAALGTGGSLAAEYDRIFHEINRRRIPRVDLVPVGITRGQHASDPAASSATAVHAGGEPGYTMPLMVAGHDLDADRQRYGSNGGDGYADRAYAEMVGDVVATAVRTSEYAASAGTYVVPHFAIEQLTEDATAAARAFGRQTPSKSITQALAVHDSALRLLGKTLRPAQQTELYFLVAQAAGLLASASADLSLWPVAMRYARAAYGYGEIIGHRGMQAYARGMQATIAFWLGKPSEAVEYAQFAAAVAPPGLAAVRAQSILARAWAHRGAGHEVGQALQAAKDACATEGADELHDVIGGEFGFAAVQQARCASTAWLQVGRHEAAKVAAVEALDLAKQEVGVVWSTLEAEARVDLATCQLLGSNLDAAHSALSDAETTLAPLWQMPTDWRRMGLFGRLGKLTALLSSRRWQAAPKARQLAEAATEFAASKPATPMLPQG